MIVLSRMSAENWKIEVITLEEEGKYNLNGTSLKVGFDVREEQQ